jgi:SnoaL-like polyketide cyclase
LTKIEYVCKKILFSELHVFGGYQMSNLSIQAQTKRDMFEWLNRLAAAKIDDIPRSLNEKCADHIHWRASHPINEGHGIAFGHDNIWAELKQALPDMERRDLIFVGGRYEDRAYIAAVGHYCGTFTHTWLSIPPNHAPLFMRYGEVYELRDGKVVQANLLWDVLDVLRQAGHWPLGQSRGREGRWEGPINRNGIVLDMSNAEQSAHNLAQTLAMHKTLADYNDNEKRGRQGLLDMPQRHHWHPKMMWYGPSGIGTTRALSGFVDHHQLPFRLAFPNRKGGSQWDEITDQKEKLGGGHYIHIGDGAFSVTGGWPSVFALHSGADFLGQPATGKVVTMRVMDFYFHDEGLIRENWVPLDILDLLRQMGRDVMAELPNKL